MSRWGEQWSGSVSQMRLGIFDGRVASNEKMAGKIVPRLLSWLHTEESRSALLIAVYGVRVQQRPGPGEENSAAIDELDGVIRVAEEANVHEKIGLLLRKAVSPLLERDLLARIVKEYSEALSRDLLAGKDDNWGGESYRLYLLLNELPENKALGKAVFSKLKYAFVEREFVQTISVVGGVLAAEEAPAAEASSHAEAAKLRGFDDRSAPAKTVALLADWLGQEENKVRLCSLFQEVRDEYLGRLSRLFGSSGRTSELRSVTELSRDNPFAAMRTLWSDPNSSWGPAGTVSYASLNLTLLQGVVEAFLADMKERLAHGAVPVEQVALVFATVALKERYLPEGEALFLKIESYLVRLREDPLVVEPADEAVVSKGGMKLE